MIVGTYENNILLRNVTDFCIENIAGYNCKSQFEIYFTDNLMEDYKIYSTNTTLKTEADGITILPEYPEEKIIVLVAVTKRAEIFNIVHELCHIFDFISFANEYCNGHLYEIKGNKYYSVLSNWLEFHVKLFDNMYSSIILDLWQGKNYDDALNIFTNQIRDLYYPKFNEKLQRKYESVQIRDIMYYLGEIAMCNIYDTVNNYDIPHSILQVYGLEILELYDVLYKCLSYEDFSKNIEDVQRVFDNMK